MHSSIAVAIIVFGLGASAALSNYAERVRPALPDDYADSDLNMRASSMRGYLFGMEGLAADWYFIRSLQYIGDKLLKVEGDIDLDDLRWLNPRLLYPLLDEATSLDPQFIAAYTYGAVVMPAIDPEKAIAIAKKGIDNNPREWRLYQYLGYVYWRLKRYDDAADAFQKGSEIEGAAPFMRLMAGSMRTEGGSRDTARKIFLQMLDDPDEQVQSIALRKLKELDALDGKREQK